MFFTIVYLSNRAPHSVLGNKTPKAMMNGKKMDLSMLSAIGARAFDPNKRFKTKFNDRSCEGKHCDYTWTARRSASTNLQPTR